MRLGPRHRAHLDAETKRAAINSAVRTIAVATPDKLGITATFNVCPSKAIDTLVTPELAADITAQLEIDGVHVHTTQHANP